MSRAIDLAVASGIKCGSFAIYSCEPEHLQAFYAAAYKDALRDAAGTLPAHADLLRANILKLEPKP